jgi:hypothetical protein
VHQATQAKHTKVCEWKHKTIKNKKSIAYR